MRRTVLFQFMRSGGHRRLRLVATTMAIALVAAGCSDDKKGSDVGAADDAGGGVTTTAVDGNDAGDGGNGGGGDDSGRRPGTGGSGRTSTTTRTRTTTTPTVAGGGPAPTTPSGGSPSTQVSGEVDTGARGAPGAYARWLLQPRHARTVVVELLVQAGAEPRQGSLDHVLTTLREVSSKQVSFAGPVALPAGDGTTDDREIRELADRYGRAPQTAEQAVIRFLFLDGGYPADDPRDVVFGVAVRGDAAAVFTNEIRGESTPVVTGSAIEAAVAMHEIGHLLGLVDLVLHTGRQDPDNRGHSRNPESVMYSSVESLLVDSVLEGPPPREFDAADLADLAAIRNGA